MSKANKDGWVRHRGGKCPVEKGTMVDVRHRDGIIVEGVFATGGPSEGFWVHKGLCLRTDIMAWRPHKAEQPNIIGFMGVEEIPVQTEKDGPIQWRDRIREIDATTIALNEERTNLVAKIKAEVFALIQSDEPNCEVESDQQDIAQQDMSDPANWRVGDLIECISFPGDGPYTEGKLYEFIEISSWGSARTIDDGGTENGIMPGQFRWHSRPSN